MEYLFSLFLCAFFVQGYTQDKLRAFTQTFEEFHQSFFLEKVYVQTNRETISLGDTLWFSAYQVDGRTHAPTRHSLLMYVELIDPTNQVLQRRSIAADEYGRGAGSFALSDTLNAGDYRLRGYTNYQRNFEEAFLFERLIKVVPRLSSQKVISNAKDVRPLERKLSFTIYPEGGDFVEGVTNYFAFQARDESGNPLAIEGNILNNKQQKVGTLNTSYGGLGKAQVNIEEGMRYACEFTYKGVSFSFPFPEIKRKGYVLNIRSSKRKVYLVAQGNSRSETGAYVLVQLRGQMLQLLQAKQGERSIYASFDREELPAGIITVTLFSASGVPLAERIFYNENDQERLNLDVQPTAKTIGTREELTLEFELPGLAEDSITALLSTSVVPASLYTLPRSSIGAYLWFHSDLIGISEIPPVFFDKQEPGRMNILDLYCLSHGWRRFDWTSLTRTQSPELTYLAEQGFSVSGRVTSYTNRKKGIASDLYLSFLDDPSIQVTGRSNEDGFFSLHGLDIQDTVDAFVKTVASSEKRKTKDKVLFNTYVSMIENQFPPAGDFEAFKMDVVEEVDTSIIQRGQKLFDISSAFDSDAIMLDEISVEDVVDPFVDPFKRNVSLYRVPDDRIVLDSLKGFNQYINVFDVLRGRVPGLMVVGNPPNQRIIIRGIASMSGNNTPLYLFDGLIVDESFISTIVPQDILYIDIIRNASVSAIYGSRAAAGVIAIYSRWGDSGQRPQPDLVGLTLFKMPGYDVPRQFYVPDYGSMGSLKLVRPDYRSTLYWNPTITVEGGSAEVNFFTSDEKGIFYILTEGITEDGRIIEDVSTLEVH